MIANVKEFEKTLIDNDLNRKQLAERVNMTPTTLSAKLDKPGRDFTLSEMVAIAQETRMSGPRFMLVFLEKNFR